MIKKTSKETVKDNVVSSSARIAYRKSYFKVNASRYTGIRNGIINKNGK